MIKVATFNVNSIRARLETLNDWLSLCNPDIVFMQELKCTEQQFPFYNFDNLPYNVEIKGQKAYNGVAILSKFPLYDVNTKLSFYGLNNDKNKSTLFSNEEDNEARFIEAKFDYNDKTIKIASIYVPNGAPKVSDGEVKDATETDSFRKKIIFYRRLYRYFEETNDNGEYGIFCGDFNTCPELIDMYSIKKDGDICCNEKERVEFRKFLQLGYCDVFRKFYGNKQEFSWWNYRFNGFKKNYGLRLDAILTTKNLTNYVKNAYVDKQIRAKANASDHVPVVVEMDI